MSELFVEKWGEGTPVVLVHGSLATGKEEWQAQQPLAELGYELRVPDRRGYGRSPAVYGEDFLRDAEDIGEVMGERAHLVAHSYGCIGAMYAASWRRDATLSLTLLEPPAFSLSGMNAPAAELVHRVHRVWDKDVPDEEWVIEFLNAVGTHAEDLPPEVLAQVVPLAPIARHGRPLWEADLPLAELRAASFPKLIVSGGHSAGFDAICDRLAEQIGAGRAVVKGAGHEIQFTGEPINDILLGLWNTKTNTR